MKRLWLVAAVLLSLLGGCVSEPTRLPLGSTHDEALRRLGTPSATYPLSDGGQRLQYARTPMGFEVSNIDLDASGHVVSVRQELFEGLFDSTIKPGVWHQADVAMTYGPPYEITRVTSFNGNVWTWRYKNINTRRLLHIYITPDGVVDHYHTSDDFDIRVNDR
jgi:hypothetical protein